MSIYEYDFEKYNAFFTNRAVLTAFKNFANSKHIIAIREVEVYKKAIAAEPAFAADPYIQQLYNLKVMRLNIWQFISFTYNGFDEHYDTFAQSPIQSYLGFQTALRNNYRPCFGMIDK